MHESTLGRKLGIITINYKVGQEEDISTYHTKYRRRENSSIDYSVKLDVRNTL